MTTNPRPKLDIDTWLWAAARSAAVQAHRLYTEDLYQPVYLAYSPGRVEATRYPAVAGLELATAERMPRHLTVDQVTAWARTLLRTCPCLPKEA